MWVLLDTNVILDRFLQRQPWYSDASALWQRIDAGLDVGFITATTVTDIFYLTRRVAGFQVALTTIADCLRAFEICPVDQRVLAEALALPGSDYEDNVQIVCARDARLDAIVTRDPAGFRTATLPVLTPAEAVQHLGR